MTDFISPVLQREPIMIHPWSRQSLGETLQVWASGASTTVGAAVAANMAIFVPFIVARPFNVTKVWWANGAVAGNADAAVYDESGNRLVAAGTTAQAGATRMQVVDVTDTVLGRGRYYMAFVASTVTTATYGRITTAAGLLQAAGCLQQDITAGGLPLPNPATFAKMATAWLPMFGVQGYRAIGP